MPGSSEGPHKGPVHGFDDPTAFDKCQIGGSATGVASSNHLVQVEKYID